MRLTWKTAASAALLAICAASSAMAQTPIINTFFPIGGQAGKTVEVEIRGASLDGANLMLVHGAGVNGSLGLSGGKADEAGKQVWQAKCSTCHELRSPANRSLSPAQWTATVERMIKARQAPISPAEAEKINSYLLSQARNGRLTAQIKIADDCMPGVYELRVVTARGVSTAGKFEVSNLPEIIAANNTRQTATVVKLPCIANGCLADNGERHNFRINAKKGQRIVFNLKAFRYNLETMLFFNPDLRLYDSAGNEIAENHGYFDFDPLIDWVCPEDGSYAIEVRDLLGRGNPGSVYRLTMGEVPYDTVIYPAAARIGESPNVQVVGKATDTVDTAFKLPAQSRHGLQEVHSPFGSHQFFVSRFPVITDRSTTTMPTKVPAAFSGHIATAGAATLFPITGEGRMEFELFSGRLNSPANIVVTLMNGAGQGVAQMGNDGRMEAVLEAGKPYSLKVEEASGKAGAEYVYAVEARPVSARLEIVTRPANVSIRPGVAAAVEVIVQRRDNIAGEITVRAEGVPPGVTAYPLVIPADRNDGLLILGASRDCKPVQAPIQIVATANGPLGPTTINCSPQELQYLQNNPRPRDVSSCVVAVRGETEFLASFAARETLKVHPRRVMEVKVKLQRRDTFKGNISARIDGLPRGWVCYPETVGADKNEMTLYIRPNGDDTRPFLTRDAKMAPIQGVLVATTDGFNLSSQVFAFDAAVCVKSDLPDEDKPAR